jgi:hypothetical protein
MGVGASPGSGLFDGDLTLESTSQLHMEFSGMEAVSQYDQIEVTGTASLNGKLIMYPLDGYEPAGGEQFEFVQASTITGNFAEIDQSRLGRKVRFDFSVGETGLMATAMPLTITSYAEWRSAFFTQSDAENDLISGPDEDPDSDGWSNRMEYLLDGNPNVPEGSPVTFALQRTEVAGQYAVEAVFDWINSVTDAIWFFETSSDLENWTEVGAAETGQTQSGDYVRTVVNFEETVDASDRIFIRMNAKAVP